MNKYRGLRQQNGTVVTVNGEPLYPRYDLANHSPDGFEWGYGGSGPAQLALAILAHHCGSDEARALRYYQEFKCAVVTGLPSMWSMDSDQIERAIQAIETAGQITADAFSAAGDDLKLVA